MDSNSPAYTTIDEYIAQYPAEMQAILQEVRGVIRAAAPEAEEKIAYQMPAFTYHGNLVYFAAFKNHIGFYPIPSGIERFAKELAVFKQGKGSVQFPLDQPMPVDLIREIVLFRAQENLEKEQAKKKAGKKPAQGHERAGLTE